MAISKPAFGCVLDSGHASAAGLIRAYLFNEMTGSTAHDLSPSAANATLHDLGSTSGSGWNTDATHGTCIMFDPTSPNDWGSAAHAAPSSNQITLMAWVKSNTPYQTCAIMGQRGSEWCMYHRDGGSLSLYGASNDFTSSTGVIGSSYCQAVIVVSNSSAVFYVNGSQISSFDMTYNLDGGSTLLGIGSSSGGAPGATWNGGIASMFIWNRALGATEISNLYATPYGMFITPSRVFFPFPGSHLI